MNDRRRVLVRFLAARPAVLRPVQWAVRWNLHLLVTREHFRHLVLPHPINVVIHERTRLLGTVRIYQGVTIGKSPPDPAVPTIGDRVTIYPNAVVAGGITVGDGAIIGAGSVVLADVPPGATVAGNPARVVREAEPTDGDAAAEPARGLSALG